MDPNNEAVVDVDGRADMMSVFARSDIVRSLEGHPACVQDLCRCVHEERSLFLRRKELLEEDIPEVNEGITWNCIVMAVRVRTI